MDKDYSKAIKTILSVIKQKLSIIDKSNINSSLQDLNYKTIEDTFKGITKKDLEEIDAEEIALLSENELDEVLDAAGKGTKDRESILENFNLYKEYLKGEDFDNKEKSRNQLQKIAGDIKLYILEYKDKSKNRTDYSNTMFETMKKYYYLFSGNNEKEIVKDIEDFDFFLTTLGLTDDIKWQAYAYLALHNINLYKSNNNQKTRFDNKIITLNEYLNKQQYLVEYIEAALDNIDVINIDEIPNLSDELHSILTSYDKPVIQNVLSTMCINALYEQINNLEDEDEINKRQVEIYDVYRSFIDDKEAALMIASDIVNENALELKSFDDMELDLDNPLSIAYYISKSYDSIYQKNIQDENIEIEHLMDLIYNYKSAKNRIKDKITEEEKQAVL